MSLQVRSRVTQRCPRRVSYRNDRSGVFHRCAAGLVLFVAEGYPVVRKSSSSEHTRYKVRRRFTLSVTTRVGGITVWALCVVASFESSSDTILTSACAGLGPPYSGSGRWVCFTGQPRTVW